MQTLYFSRVFILVILFVVAGCANEINQNEDSGCLSENDCDDIGSSDEKVFIAEVSAGGEHTCGISASNGKLYCWGADWSGQLGDGVEKTYVESEGNTDMFKPFPLKINDAAWTTISAGQKHSCGIESDGRLYCWGNNDLGKIGDGTENQYEQDYGDTGCLSFGLADDMILTDNNNRSLPTLIGSDSWIQVTAGSQHSCGLNKERILYCWGNSYMLSSDARAIGASRVTPFQMSPAKWRKVSAGVDHTCAIMLNNDLYCWGGNTYGQVGDGTICAGYWGSCYKAEMEKISDIDWVDISSGNNHSCALDISNKLYCWGKGYSSTPQKISEDTWITISSGNLTSCGIKSDDKLYCWKNDNGGSYSAPVKVNDDKWIQIGISKTGGHMCGIKSDNKLYCWGDNNWGQLGDGTDVPKEVPTQIQNF